MKAYRKGLFLSMLSVCIIVGSSTVSLAGRPKDETIAFWVKEVLREDSRVDVSEIKVKVESGIVTLTGQVSGLASKRYADRETKKITGVRGVINEIVVFVPHRSDTDIMQDILRGFLNSADIELRDIAVKVVDGRVTLSGEVDSWMQRDEAELIATELRGVKSVDNQVKVIHKEERSDMEIREDVTYALGRDVYLLDTLIHVNVKEGTVTLTGYADSAYQKDRATQDALFVANVEAVKNYLEIGQGQDEALRKKPPLPSDKELKKTVRDELYQDLRIEDPYQIEVEAIDGHVILRGTVASHYQKRIAGYDAHDIVGVVWVSNLLSVGTEWREDPALRDDVRFALDADSAMKGLNITVRVKDGVVMLYGDVNNPYDKEHASDVASRVVGVRDVVNRITVNKTIKSADTALKTALKERMKILFRANWETHWVADQIKIGVKGGFVILTGNVNTWSEYKEAARIASLIHGVRGVVNRLRVKGVDYPWDEYSGNP